MTLAVCRPDIFPIRRVLRCPTENKRRRMAGHVALWYGATITCLGCGDTWTDGEMHPRPFKPRWRQEAIASAHQAWADADGLTKADYKAWFDAEMKEATR